MGKIIAAIAVIALCASFAACDKASGKPAAAKKTTVSPAPTPSSKWVGRWVNQKGNTSYVIESEKSGALYGYMINEGGGRDRVVMKLTGPNSAFWVTPIGVRVNFTYQGKNQVLVSAVGVAAAILKIVK